MNEFQIFSSYSLKVAKCSFVMETRNSDKKRVTTYAATLFSCVTLEELESPTF